MSILMLQVVGADLRTHKILPALAHVVIARQRVERERNPVEVILQIENAGKTSARELVLVPRPVRILVLEKPRYSTLNGRVIRSYHGKQSDQTPGGLRSRARAFRFQRRIVIRKN